MSNSPSSIKALAAASARGIEPINLYLKQGTADLHAKVEKRLAQHLFLSDLRPEQYLCIIKAMEHCYRHIEAVVSHYETPRILLEDRSKLTWLGRDIQHLSSIVGIHISHHSLRPLETAPVNEAQAMGMMYVMEGATLGGGFIQRKLQKFDWLAHDHGLQFFASYTNQREVKWQAFLDKLTEFTRHHPESESDTLVGAKLAFSNVYQAIGEIE